MPTTAKYEVDKLFKDLVDQFRRARLPMPVVVLYAEEPAGGLDGEVEQVVEALHEAQENGELPYRVVEPAGSGDPHRDAIATLDGLARGAWARHGHAWYRHYAFPRSRLISAVESAAQHVIAEHAGSGRPLEDLVDEVLVRLRELRWRAERRPTGQGLQRALAPVFNSTTLIGAFVLAWLTTLVTQANGVLVGGVVLAGFLLVALSSWVGRNTAQLSWLGQASRWFATTTFLAASGRQAAAWSLWRPRMSWDVTQARAREVAGEIIKAQLPGTAPEERDRAQQFHLQLRTLALLEDLRVAHRNWALDLRDRKRRVPPVVFMPRAGADNGGLRVLGAISDVRSRRSEQDPLLVIAGIANADVRPWLEGGGSGELAGAGPARSRQSGSYESWIANLRVRQAPSQGRALAWTLPVRLGRAQLLAGNTTGLAPVPVGRSLLVFWSRWTLLVLLVLAGIGGVLRSEQLADRYCESRLLATNGDAVWRTDPAGTRECIGVGTGQVEFGSPEGVQLSGALPGQRHQQPQAGDGITVASVEQAIRAENERVAALPDVRWITVVYAGALTTAAGQEARGLNGLKELVGVHLAQLRNNAGDPLKIKVLIANAGQDMYFQRDTVDRIVAVAQRDRSIVGVVGLGRDTTDSDDTVGVLQRAGLAVVDTTNSSSDLARRHVNYFGLAATDEEEAAALRQIVDGLQLPPAERWAAVLTRRPSADRDQYSLEQAKYGQRMLTDAGYQLAGGGPLEYGLTSNGDPDYEEVLRTGCRPDRRLAVIYLAGRSDDVNQLMRKVAADPNCSRGLTVLAGDDLTKAQFHSGATWVAPQVTLYYIALTDPAATAGQSDLADVAAAELGITPPGTGPARYEDDVYSDGSLALAYDATAALHAGAAKAEASQTGGLAAVMAGLRAVDLRNRAIGTVDFRETQPLVTGTEPGHGIYLVRVAKAADGTLRIERLCGRAAGDPGELTGCRP